jgi:hypothetical protein
MGLGGNNPEGKAGVHAKAALGSSLTSGIHRDSVYNAQRGSSRWEQAMPRWIGLLVLLGALWVADTVYFHSYYRNAVLSSGGRQVAIFVDGARNLANRISP